MKRALSGFASNIKNLAPQFERLAAASTAARKTTTSNFEIQSKEGKRLQAEAVDNALKGFKAKRAQFDKESEIIRKGTELAIANRNKQLKAAKAAAAKEVEIERKKQEKITADAKVAALRRRADLVKERQARRQRAVDEQRGRKAVGFVSEQIGAERLRGPVELRARIGSQLADLKATVKSTRVSASRVIQIFRDMKRGIVGETTEAENKVRRRLLAIQTSMGKLAKANKGAVGQIALDWKTLARIGSFQIVHGLISRATLLLREAITTAKDYGKTIALIQTLVEDSVGSFDDWSDVIREVSEQFGTGLEDTAKAVFEAVSNQIVETTEQARTFGQEIAKLARVTNSSLDDTGKTVAGLVNSYKTGLDGVNEINAKLFAAVDLGKFTIAEVAEQLGRAAPQANQLGVSLDELLAGLSTFTIEGRNANASITLMRNVLLKLLKPSEEFQALLQEWGFSTGQAAAQQLGLIGIIRRLNTQVSQTRLGTLFQDMRAIEGITTLTSNSFENFASNFAKIGGSAARRRLEQLRGELGGITDELVKQTRDFDPIERFERAFAITEATPFIEFEKEITRVSNLFSQSLGNAFFETFSVLNKEIGGLSRLFEDLGKTISQSVVVNVFSDVASTIGQLTNSTVGLRNVILTIAVALSTAAQAWVVLKVASVTGISQLISGLVTARKSIVATQLVVGNFVGKVAAFVKSPVFLITAVITVVEILKARYRELDNIQEEFLEKTERVREAAIKASQQSSREELEDRRDNLQESIVDIGEFFAKRIALARDNQKSLEDSEKEFTSFLKTTLNSRIKNFEAFVSAIRSEIKKINDNIAKRSENITNLQISGSRRVFDSKINLLKIEDSLEAEAFNKRISRLESELKATEAAIETSKKQVLELQQLEERTRFDFLQSLRTEEESFNALISRINTQLEEANQAVTAGQFTAATDLIGKAEQNNRAAQQIISSQLEAAKTAAQAARVAATKEGISAAERSKQLDLEAKSFADAREALTKLSELERERKAIVEDRIGIEQEAQAAQLAEQERLKKALESVRRQQLEITTQQRNLTERRIGDLDALAFEATQVGNIKLANTFLKEQDELLQKLSASTLKQVEAATKAQQFDTVESLLKDLSTLEFQRARNQEDRVKLEQDSIKASRNDQVVLQEKLSTVQRNLVQFKTVASEIKNIRFFDADGNAKDVDTILGQFKFLARELDILSETVTFEDFAGLQDLQSRISLDVNKFGEQINLLDRFNAAIGFLSDKTREFEGISTLPLEIKTDLEKLQAELEDTNARIQSGELADLKPIRIKFDLEDVEKLGEQVNSVLITTRENINTVGTSLTGLLTRRIELRDQLTGQFDEAQKTLEANLNTIREIEDVGTLEATLKGTPFGALLDRGGTPEEVFNRIRAGFQSAQEAASKFGDTNAFEVKAGLAEISGAIDQINFAAQDFEARGALGLFLGGNIDVKGIASDLEDLQKLLIEQVQVIADITAAEAAQKQLDARSEILDELATKMANENNLLDFRNTKLDEENKLLATNITLRKQLSDILADSNIDDIRPGGGTVSGGSSTTTTSTTNTFNFNVEVGAGESAERFVDRIGKELKRRAHQGVFR
jgi:TP901 family phage tail tape measure protein